MDRKEKRRDLAAEAADGADRLHDGAGAETPCGERPLSAEARPAETTESPSAEASAEARPAETTESPSAEASAEAQPAEATESPSAEASAEARPAETEKEAGEWPEPAPEGTPAAMQTMAPPKRKRRWLWNLLLIAVIGLGIYSMFGISGELVDGERLTFGEVLGRVDVTGLILLLCVVLGVMITDCCKFMVVNKAVLGRVRPAVAIKTNFLGKFYDGITPFATGGQPMQIYYMTTKGVSGGAASAVVLIRYFGSMFAFTVLGAAFMIAGAAVGVLDGVDGKMLLTIAGWVGLVVNFLLPLFILFFALFPRLARKLTGWVIFVGYKLRIVKRKERAMRKALRTVKDFIVCFRIIARKPLCLVLFLLFCFIENLLTLSVPYFVMNALSCPLDGMFFTVIALNVYTTFGVSFIPTPGNSGVVEGMGVLAFSVAAGATLAWSVLFWRFGVYYIYILIGLVLTVIDLFRKNIGRRKRSSAQKDERA